MQTALIISGLIGGAEDGGNMSFDGEAAEGEAGRDTAEGDKIRTLTAVDERLGRVRRRMTPGTLRSTVSGVLD